MIKKITTDDLRRMTDREGLILQGCGGDPQEWLDGINGLLGDAGILLEAIPSRTYRPSSMAVLHNQTACWERCRPKPLPNRPR